MGFCKTQKVNYCRIMNINIRKYLFRHRGLKFPFLIRPSICNRALTLSEARWVGLGCVGQNSTDFSETFQRSESQLCPSCVPLSKLMAPSLPQPSFPVEHRDNHKITLKMIFSFRWKIKYFPNTSSVPSASPGHGVWTNRQFSCHCNRKDA